MKSKCDHCPLLLSAESCRGQRNDRVCQRANPKSPDHSPGFLRKLANFAVAFVEHVAAGAPMATAEVKAERLAVCSTCEFHDAARDRCNQCGCGLSLKASWADSTCPIGKWLAISIST